MFVLILMRFCVSVSSPSVQDKQHYQENEVDHKHRDEVLLNVIRPEYERPAPPPPMEPLYPLTEKGKVQGKDMLLIFLQTGYQKINIVLVKSEQFACFIYLF